MPHFLLKLVSPRASFPHDMTPTEAQAMARHAAYWAGLAERRIAVVVGPVADPGGFWGLAIVESESEAATEELRAEDPIISGNLGFRYETYAMPQVLLRPAAVGAATA